jgi:phytanoyl-CoA hydroxylase
MDPRVRPHRLNTDFTWRPPRGPFRRLTPAQARAYDERGYFVLEDVFSAHEMGAVVAAIDPVEARVEAFLQGAEGGRVFIARAGEITFTTHMVLRSAFLRRFVAGPVFRDLCFDLIGPDVRLYWDQAVYKKPGTTSPFPWHQDNGYTFIEPQQYLTCWVALTDATEDNGCPWVVPGLHRHGTLAHELSDLGWVCLHDAPDAVPVPVRAGSIAVFSSLTPHSTGGNRTTEVRKAYIVQFAPDGAAIVTTDDVAAGIRPGPVNDPDRQFPILIAGVPVETDA